MDDPLAAYTFLPWLRQGIGRRIATVDTLGSESALIERAAITVSLSVNNTVPISNQVQLVGPGDVVGINPRAIIKTEPRHWITDFEPNYLAFIEFYEEDFPWRYTPARATAHRLRPWIFLAVLAEDEFERKQIPGAPLSTITLNKPASEVFPAGNQTWAWAHVHVSKDITNNSQRSASQAVDALENLIEQNADEASSRLLCPRRLKPNTGYFAFVIPTFETGRLAGLGQATAGIDALKSSWGNGQADYPVYYEWFFRTGERGDFEFLVNLLEARPVDKRVGVRDMDVQAPDFDTPGMTDPPVIGLEGALQAPNTVSRPQSWPPNPLNNFVTKLQEKVNFQSDLLAQAGPSGHPDPIISPPLYGRWHAKVDRLAINEPGWINELNGDPRLRVPAGLGTKTIQTHQEDYMRRAWQQLGDVLKANRKICHAQLALVTSHRIYTQKLLSLSDDQFIASARALLPHVKDTAGTVYKKIQQSRLPTAALHSTFRRVMRPRGVIAKKLQRPGSVAAEPMLVALNAGRITAALKKKAPKNQFSLAKATKKIKPTSIPGQLGSVTIRSRVSRRFIKSSTLLSEKGLTVATLKQVQPRNKFTLTQPGKTPPISDAKGQDSKQAASFRVALNDLHGRLDIALPSPPNRTSLQFNTTVQTLARALNPAKTIPNRIRSIIAIPPSPRSSITIDPVMAHPQFADPMYAPLRDISSELLVPNLNLIPMNTISLLKTNRRFIEAYMVGLNHEMSRELLWREFPTDQRGSYFRQFWDVNDVLNRLPDRTAADAEESLRDIRPLHNWSNEPKLGAHENRDLPAGDEPDEARLVLVIRGDLLKKYPTAVIYAQQAKWGLNDKGQDIRVLHNDNPQQRIREPMFKAEIDPDLKFLGFDLTASEAKGDPQRSNNNPGWFFVIQERPGEPRFGLDVPNDNGLELKEWNDLAWSHLAMPDPVNFIDIDKGPSPIFIENIRWGSNAAEMAFILFQQPVMVAVHASNMLQGLDS